MPELDTEAVAPASPDAPPGSGEPLQSGEGAAEGAPGGGPASSAEGARQAARLLAACAAITLGACLLLVVAKIAVRFDIATLWDDAYMFHRYAKNLVDEGRIAWNPHGEPTYGLTTPLVLLLTVPLYLVTGKNPALSVMLTSTLAGVAFVALSAFLLRRMPSSGGSKLVGAVLCAVCFALSASADHFVSGMDTTFALAYLTLWLIVCRRLEEAQTSRLSIALGLLGGIAFWARPDLMAYTLSVPAALAALAREPRLRRAGRLSFAACAVTLLGVLLVNRVYFQSWLPLPFFAKSLGLYGTSIARAYRGTSTVELTAFLVSYWPLFALIGVGAWVGARRGLLGEPLELALALGTLVLLLYYWLIPLPVMYFSSRFYQPTLPALFWLSWRAIGRLEGAVLPLATVLRAGPASALGALLLAGACAAVAPAALTTSRDVITAVLWTRIGRFEVAQHAKAEGPQGYWYRFDRFAALPDDLVIATTEVGMLSALAPGKVIIDLAGLNERELALERFDADRFFARHSPDLVYMPHPHYREMTSAIRRSSAFRRYEAFDKKALGTREFGIAIRKDSKHYAAMRALVETKSE